MKYFLFLKFEAGHRRDGYCYEGWWDGETVRDDSAVEPMPVEIGEVEEIVNVFHHDRLVKAELHIQFPPQPEEPICTGCNYPIIEGEEIYHASGRCVKDKDSYFGMTEAEEGFR